MENSTALLAALRRYWGYESFRPMQERIVSSLLGGVDIAVIMPTGGGKSLCYQLPALVSGRTAIVISPLIALMHDQVAQLKQMGIPAALVNSAMPQAQQGSTIQEAIRGGFRLLYLSPERLARPDTVAWLQRVPIAFFAIDEAHCISEWGHEFRPEYRQLSSLRANFPDRPIAAFTASATRRVRHDIVAQLQLRDPHKYIVSFHRPNLRYLVKECEERGSQERLLVSALRAHSGENAIVYAPTIARVEETVDFLGSKNIAALPYHGQMETNTRKRNQERWMSDDVRVLVGTIAFGLGINKPGVRTVIHLSLPKSVEQYYQEAGRAGRDGEPADCALLWQQRDVGLLAYFNSQVQDGAERQRAWQRYEEIRKFVTGGVCRHRQICLHFGETPKWEKCGMCDVCADLPDWMLGRAGTLSVSGRVRQALKAVNPLAGPDHLDLDLLAYLKQWRREVSVRDNVPAFIILHDSGIEDLARRKPKNRKELLQVSGIGEKKSELYGSAILEAIGKFRQGARAGAPEPRKSESPAEETMRLLKEGRTFEEIAKIRERRLASVIDLVADLVERGILPFDENWIEGQKRLAIEAAAARFGMERMKPIKDALPEEIGYGEIRLVVSRLRATRTGA